MNATNIAAVDAMRHITLKVKVTGVVALKLRIKIGSALMRLAALVMGCELRIELE